MSLQVVFGSWGLGLRAQRGDKEAIDRILHGTWSNGVVQRLWASELGQNLLLCFFPYWFDILLVQLFAILDLAAAAAARPDPHSHNLQP